MLVKRRKRRREARKINITRAGVGVLAAVGMRAPSISGMQESAEDFTSGVSLASCN